MTELEIQELEPVSALPPQARSHHHARLARACTAVVCVGELEATAGIEPACTDFQSVVALELSY